MERGVKERHRDNDRRVETGPLGPPHLFVSRPVPWRLTRRGLEQDRRGLVVVQRDRSCLRVEHNIRRQRHLPFAIAIGVQAKLDHRVRARRLRLVNGPPRLPSERTKRSPCDECDSRFLIRCKITLTEILVPAA